MKILYVTTVGGTMDFFKDIIKHLVMDGNVVDIATNNSVSKVSDFYFKLGCRIFPITTSRSPFSFGNLKAIKQIKAIAKDYDIVHCHTPLAGMATRLACRGLRKRQGLKIVYTAHGFHFFRGSKMKNWLLYYPIEKFCSRLTDALITINSEDYSLAKRRMKAGKTVFMHGVGIDISKFLNQTCPPTKKEALGLAPSDFVVLSVGELNRNKNHALVVKALGMINKPNVHYLVAGVGKAKRSLERLAQKKNVHLHLLGYRNDVAELYKIADLYVHPSFREGLPVALMEAIASGRDCICSDVRGCRDLVSEGLFNPKDASGLSKIILEHLYRGRKNGMANTKTLEAYDISHVIGEVECLYKELMLEKKSNEGSSYSEHR